MEVPVIGPSDPVHPSPLEPGITLRTYLAAHAPVEPVMGYGEEIIARRVQAAVAWADLIIKELNK